MTVVIFNILALLWMLPLQTASYFKTLSHVAEHSHEHDEGEHHHHDEPDQPPHSHDKDIWGLFAMQALGPDAPRSEIESTSFSVHPSFDVHTFTSTNLCQGLFRPPIG